jgi:hypothetical protein
MKSFHSNAPEIDGDAGGRLDRAFSFRAILTILKYDTFLPHGNYGPCGG